jgi:TRAP-type C4-dicarboxylate transport system permease small subunit
MKPRRALDALYDGAGVVAALFLVGTLVFVLIGIAGRLLHFHVPGTDAYAGYCMAAAGFLALAHTLKRGEHIRVTLIVEHLASARRLWVERAALAVATLLAGLFAYFSLRLAFQSWQFNDISTATDATPLWLPQLAMAFGTLILFVAVADELVADLRGHRRRSAAEAALHNE